MTEREILDELDQQARQSNFPGLGNTNYPLAKARLTAFRSPSEWLMTFELVAYGEKEAEFVDVVHAYGNRVDGPGWRGQVPVVTPAAGHPMWDDDGNFLLDLSDFEVVVRGKPERFTPSARDYARAGIRADADMPPPLELIRFLAHLAPGRLFLTDAELLEAAGRTGSGLKRFLQLDDWHHPDPIEKELPSTTPCLRRLAEALANNDPSRYACPDKEKNTHWSHWEV